MTKQTKGDGGKPFFNTPAMSKAIHKAAVESTKEQVKVLKEAGYDFRVNEDEDWSERFSKLLDSEYCALVKSGLDRPNIAHTFIRIENKIKEYIASELIKARDEAYKDGARTQAEMDAKLVSEARSRGQLDLVRAISKIADELTDDELLTIDYDEFAERVLKLVDKLKSKL